MRWCNYKKEILYSFFGNKETSVNREGAITKVMETILQSLPTPAFKAITPYLLKWVV
ncbi:MAG: hypothetical protein IH946_08555 [Bacteroidetes bacterium]|nr:hypothetical protein [Bacteroidota bacterium]